MPKASQAVDSLPSSVQVSLEILGEHLRLGRDAALRDRAAPENDAQALAQYIDGPHLKPQRAAFSVL